MPNTKKTSKCCQISLNFGQKCDEISPNLVTLILLLCESIDHRYLREIDCSFAIVGGLAAGMNVGANQYTCPTYSVKKCFSATPGNITTTVNRGRRAGPMSRLLFLDVYVVYSRISGRQNEERGVGEDRLRTRVFFFLLFGPFGRSGSCLGRSLEGHFGSSNRISTSFFVQVKVRFHWRFGSTKTSTFSSSENATTFDALKIVIHEKTQRKLCAKKSTFSLCQNANVNKF